MSEEIDRQVAEAVGYGIPSKDRPCETTLTGLDGNFLLTYPEGDSKTFRPSTDWNDAMWAAEKVGLFSSLRCLWKDQAKGNRWFVVWINMDGTVGQGLESIWAYGESGPLAICQAILRLAKPTPP